jgi:hypothetical protein
MSSLLGPTVASQITRLDSRANSHSLDRIAQLPKILLALILTPSQLFNFGLTSR